MGGEEDEECAWHFSLDVITFMKADPFSTHQCWKYSTRMYVYLIVASALTETFPGRVLYYQRVGKDCAK